MTEIEEKNMFLQLSHTKLKTYETTKQLIIECYKLTASFPSDEKFALVQQIRRAAVSVFLNYAEGCSRTSAAERKRFFEISRGSLIEVDAAFDLAVSLKHVNLDKVQQLGELIIINFKLLTGLITKYGG
jgi:four helix bundle protein